MPRLEYTEHTTDEPIWINTSSVLIYTIQIVQEALTVYFQKTIIKQWRININSPLIQQMKTALQFKREL